MVRSPITHNVAIAVVAARARCGLVSGSQRIRRPVVARVPAPVATATAISGTTGIAATRAIRPVRHGLGSSRSSHQMIAEVKISDEVLSTDPITGATQGERVTATHDNQDEDLADVTVREVSTGLTTVVHTTWHHPLWNADSHQWTEAMDLRPGDHLRSPDGSANVIVLQVKAWTGLQRMRDLTVDDSHTYYVVAGTTPVLVHNCNLIPESHIHVDSLNSARDVARQLSGLGDDAVPFMQEIGPNGGKLYSGMRSADGTRGWRIDFDRDSVKGVHVNWWDRSSGLKCDSGWKGGAAILDGFTGGDYLQIINHFPWT
jgi:hypothetical protein